MRCAFCGMEPAEKYFPETRTWRACCEKHAELRIYIAKRSLHQKDECIKEKI